MLGFKIDFWDYVTFATASLAGICFVLILLLLGGLPGRIAIARKHPDAAAVNIMGWAGFLLVVPWIQAFIWAFKPTNIIDIRRFPQEEALAVDEEIAHLRGVKPAPAPAPPAHDSATAYDEDAPSSASPVSPHAPDDAT